MPINIHSKNIILNFTAGKYHINVLGGWLIVTNGFSIKIVNELNKEPVDIRRSKWPVQNIEFGQRSKRTFDFEIQENGKYVLEFVNPELLKVRRSNVAIFPPFCFFNTPKNNEKTTITIHRK